ncbi:MAG: hypothetical protein J0I21_11390 [Alphaproteobacteria bacterium]|nr:hypothetical protein [Alphaproteobacteria bacterium]
MKRTLFVPAGALALVLAAAGAAQASPQSYLQAAAQAVQGQHRGQALAALDRAEADALDRQPQATRGDQEAEDSPFLRQIGRARQAVAERDWGNAATSITEAMRLSDQVIVPGSQSQ